MNYEDAKKYLNRYLAARTPVIIIQTIEKNRVLKMLKEIDYEFNIYSMTNGMVNLKSNIIVNEEKTTKGALDYIMQELKTSDNKNYVLSDISDIESATDISRYLLDVIFYAEKKSGTIILISSENIWPNISHVGVTIKLDIPSENELVSIIKDTLAPYEQQLRIAWDDYDYKTAANILQGMNEMEVKNIMTSIVIKGEIKKEDLEELKQTKKNFYKNVEGLELTEIEREFDLAGLEKIKSWIESEKNLFTSKYKTELDNRGMFPPRGILITGIPGCGKSSSPKAISKILNLPLYRLDLTMVETEEENQTAKKLKKVLNNAAIISPCILWIDEIEKLFNSSSNKGRLLNEFIIWLQTNKKTVFIVATANNLEQIPEELTRKGIFDEIFFIDIPNMKERKEIIDLYLRKYLRVTIGTDLSNRLVQISDGFASSDIEASIRKIAYKLISNPNEQLTEQLMESTLSEINSITKTNPEKITRLREWARTKAISASKNE